MPLQDPLMLVKWTSGPAGLFFEYFPHLSGRSINLRYQAGLLVHEFVCLLITFEQIIQLPRSLVAVFGTYWQSGLLTF